MLSAICGASVVLVAVLAGAEPGEQAPASAGAQGAEQRAGQTGVVHPLGFWVGAWDVYNRKGDMVGLNELTFQAGGAVVHESWISTKWGSGVSINYIDSVEKRIVQVWVSQNGDRLMMSAPLSEVTTEGVRMEGMYHLADGGTRLHVTELTVLEGGFVRQHITEPRGDDVWTTVFDAIYVPRGGELPGWWGEEARAD